jgi:carboxylesterase
MFKKNKIKIGLFLIHGYLSDPEISYPDLAKILDKNKIENYYFPLIQGHGKGINANTFNYKEAIEKIENEYLLFRMKYDIVYIVGFSMGGALAFYLAEKFSAEKIVLLAPSLKYGGDNRLLSKVGESLKSSKEDELAKDVMKRALKNDIETKEILEKFLRDNSGDGAVDYKRDFEERLGHLKVSVFLNFMKLISFIRRATDKTILDIPARLYISENDDLVPLAGPMYAFERIEHDDKKLVVFSGVKHRILMSKLKKEIIEDMLKFLYGKKKIKWIREKK